MHRHLLALVLLLTACAPTPDVVPEVVPAPAAAPVPGDQPGMIAQVANIEVVVRPEVWPGEAPFGQEVLPMRVTITNEGDRPIRLRYGDFALVASGGPVYAALPPFRIAGTVEEPVLATDYGPIDEPWFEAAGFEVAPYVAPLYPHLPVAGGPLFVDPLYNETYYDRWLEYELPTEEMLERALPEGTLDPGGRVSGYLYFEQPAPALERAQFRFDLIGARAGERLGTLTVPFVVP